MKKEDRTAISLQISEVKKQVKKDMNNGSIELSLTMEKFNMMSNQLFYIDDIQTSFSNQFRGLTINQFLAKSSNWNKIQELRRQENDENSDKETPLKKERAKLEKISLVEVINDPNITLENVNEYIYKIADEAYQLEKSCQTLEYLEKDYIRQLENYMNKLAVYSGYIKNVKGIGTKTAAKLIAGIGDIRRFSNPAKLWSYCGLGQFEKDENGQLKALKKKTGVQLHHSPKMRALLFVISENFIKAKSQYRIVYDDRKRRTLITHPEWYNLKPDGTPNEGNVSGAGHPKHADTDAKRVMIKRFLAELFVAWYESLNIPVPCEPYGVEIQGHHKEPQIVKFNH